MKYEYLVRFLAVDQLFKFESSWLKQVYGWSPFITKIEKK